VVAEAEAVVIQVRPLVEVLQDPMAKLHQETMPGKTGPTNLVTGVGAVVAVVAGAVAKAEPHPEEIKEAMLDHMA
jgi:hypothetical protein